MGLVMALIGVVVMSNPDHYHLECIVKHLCICGSEGLFACREAVHVVCTSAHLHLWWLCLHILFKDLCQHWAVLASGLHPCDCKQEAVSIANT